ncbi:MAG: HEAT repeat domain-containing protein [Ignavibacteria bacterium]|nr:HEAT repeat domain-containing protein [Ignavibacteria bacterium]
MFKVKVKIFLIFFIVSFYLGLAQVTEVKPSQKHATSFAIIIDETTYTNCKDAVLTYKKSVEDDGLSTYILVNDWKNPDQVKKEILRLYNQKPILEGVVFIGDIPIPMIRNAQHMTSAFKLDEEKYPWFRSSVPSDRFYDDFDLKFQYLRQDTVNKLSHYYALLPDSPQRIARDIYSARIKPSGLNINKYEIISSYLNRVAKIKKEKNIVDNALVFLGHGYISNSLTAWADEKLSLQEEFPGLFVPGGRLKDLFHEMDRELKEILIRELQQEGLDIALFHAHGDTDLQLLISYPIAQNVDENLESVKLYLRSKLRSAKQRKQSVEKTKEYFMKEYNIPDSFFDGTFSDSSIVADSILGYKLDMYLDDIRKMKPEPKFIMFDECFNGSFHLDEYVAGEYVFGKGNVVVGEGNSVNCLQDKWADEFLGWLNKGVRIGLRHKEINLLESHLIGDPTFKFSSDSKYDLNKMLVLEKNNVATWRKILTSEDDIIRETAVRMLYYNLKEKFEKELVDIYQKDKSFNVRLHALKSLAEINGDGFRNILFKSINDPSEYIRRKTAEWMGEVGDEKYLPELIKAVFTDESDRVVFNGKSALGFISIKKSADAIKNYIANLPKSDMKVKLEKGYLPSLDRNQTWVFDEIIPNIKNDTLKLSKRIQEAKTFRNYKFRDAIPVLIELLGDKKQPDSLRSSIIEALGWFSFTLDRDSIIKAAENILNDPLSSPLLKSEATKTKNRMLEGVNEVMLP